MKYIRLIKGKSYAFKSFDNGRVVKAKLDEGVLVSDKDSEYAVSTGYFEIIPTVGVDGAKTKDIATCSKGELIKIANDKGINISGCKTKPDILEAIRVYLTAADLKE